MMHQRRNRRTAVLLGLVLCAMLGLVAASVPLYRLFCEVTGFAGTTQRADADTSAVSARVVTVRFNTDISPQLPWRFQPVEPEVKVHLGEEKLVYFRATNLSKEPLVGHATFNVTPAKTGLYFNKIQCFCFDEERLGPGETIDMPVDFFVDPAMEKDVDAQDVDTITLSYTFFPSLSPQDAKDLSRFDEALAQATPPDPARGHDLFQSQCGACHALDRNRVGPSLAGVLGRKSGTMPGFAYSPALKAASVDWSAETLDRWLADPRALVPGTKMPAKVLDATVRRDIIAYLGGAASHTQTAAAPSAINQ